MAFQGDSIFWVEVGKIVPNPYQPRKEFNKERLQELAESIRMYGILQPLTVTRKEIQKDNGAFYTEYELIAGERRLRAAKLAGLEQVPVIIRSGEDTEQEKLELAIIENLQREDLNAVDRALALKQLADVFKLSHAEVGKKVGRSRMYVSNSIRLLNLPEVILNSLREGELSEGHARTLLMLKDRPQEQDVVYREILLKKLSVREVERIARKIATDKVRKKKWNDTDARLIEIEREFTNTLGTRVQIAKTDFGGKLTIDYFSDEDLEKLLNLVRSQKGNVTLSQMKENDSDESQTVIREMSPEATTLAKIATATPLEVLETEVNTETEESISIASADAVTEVTHKQEQINKEDVEIRDNLSSIAMEEQQPLDSQQNQEINNFNEPVIGEVEGESLSEQVAGDVSNPIVNEPVKESLYPEGVTDQQEAVLNKNNIYNQTQSDFTNTNEQQNNDQKITNNTDSGFEHKSENDEDDDLYSIRNFSL